MRKNTTLHQYAFIAAFLFFYNALAQIPTQNLVWQYKFDNNLNDTSASSFNAGALTASASNHTYNSGIANTNTTNSIQLQGDMLVNNGNVSFASNQRLFTLSFWIKLPSNFTNFNANTDIIKVKDPNADNYIKISSDGNNLKSQIFSNSSGINLTTSTALTNIRDNNWHHIAVKGAHWSAGFKYYNQLYIDGVKVSEIFDNLYNLNNLYMFGGTDITIGNNAATSDVQLDNLRFYKVDLPDADITALYQEKNQQDAPTSLSIQGQGGVNTITTANGTLQMQATVLPNTASQDVTWSVDNPLIATIDATTGVLSALADGSVVVSASVNADTTINANTTITVSNQGQSPGQNNIPTQDLVAEYLFNTNVDESSSSSYNAGTLSSATNQATYVNGSMLQDTNGAIALQGDTFVTSNAISFASNQKLFTLSFWIKLPPTFGMNTEIIKIKDPVTNNFIKIYSDGTNLKSHINSTTSGMSLAASTALVNLRDNNWHHIVVKGAYWTAGNKYYNQLYVDGTKVHEDSKYIGLQHIQLFNGATITVGNSTSTADVSLDNLRFYKAALVDADITNLYNERYQRATATLSTTAFNTNTIQAIVYPNPVSDILYVKTQEKVEEISIYDATTKRVLHNKEQNTIALDLLPTGWYMAHIKTKHGAITKQIIKK